MVDLGKVRMALSEGYTVRDIAGHLGMSTRGLERELGIEHSIIRRKLRLSPQERQSVFLKECSNCGGDLYVDGDDCLVCLQCAYITHPLQQDAILMRWREKDMRRN